MSRSKSNTYFHDHEIHTKSMKKPEMVKAFVVEKNKDFFFKKENKKSQNTLIINKALFTTSSSYYPSKKYCVSLYIKMRYKKPQKICYLLNCSDMFTRQVYTIFILYLN